MPGDVAMERQAFSGRPAVELAGIARGGDLLVLGSRCKTRPSRTLLRLPTAMVSR
jgi:hypothetical protein